MSSIYEAVNVEAEANRIYRVVPRDVQIYCADTGHDVVGMESKALLEGAKAFDLVEFIYRDISWQILPAYYNLLGRDPADSDAAEHAKVRAVNRLRADMTAATVYNEFGKAFPRYDTPRYLEHPVKFAATILAGRAVRRYFEGAMV